MIEKVTVPCPRCNAKLRMPVFVRPGKKPKCPRCGTVVRPEQVLIPENLPTEKMMSELQLPSLPDGPADEHELAEEPPPSPPIVPTRPISSLDETFVPTPERPSPLPPGGLRETVLPNPPPDPSRRRPPSAPSTPDVRRPPSAPSAPDLRETEVPKPKTLRETEVPRQQPLRETDFVPRPGLPPPASLPPAMAPADPARPSSAGVTPIVPPYDPTGSSADFDDPNKPPPDVPGFQILAPLGRGANGVVYRVRQAGLKRDAALKMLLGGQYVDPAARARFLVEAEAAAQLRHPGVVQVYVYGEHHEQPYLCMEYVDGGTLGRKLRRGVLAPAEAAGLMAHVADAVAHAHAAKIVHRDLKPANILLTTAGVPKVTDFGLAKQMDATDPASTGMLIGSPSYMSPEQASGQVKKVGPASDVFALGAILYECLAGRPPFRGETMLDTLRMAVNEDPTPLRELAPGVPKSLETICMKCLAKDPPDRYPTAAELAADLHRWERGEPIQAKPPGPWERARGWVRRHPRRTAGVIGALLLLVVVAVLLFAL